MIFRRGLTASALALALVACGGGGGSPTPTATGGAATPAPSPAPAPSPSPSPTTQYPAFDDLTGVQEFRAGCAAVSSNGGVLQGGLSASPNDIELFPLTLDVAAETWSLVFSTSTTQQDPNSLTGPRSYAPVDAVADPPAGTIAYRKANLLGGTDDFSVTLQDFGAIGFDYLRGSSYLGQSGTNGFFVNQSCVFGVPILVEDVRTDTVTYADIVVTGTAYLVDNDSGGILATFDLQDSSATFDFEGNAAEPIEGKVNTTIQLRGREVQNDGSLSQTVTEFRSVDDIETFLIFGDSDRNRDLGAFEGDFFVQDPFTFRGRLTGWFYGPDAVEAGYAFQVDYFQEKETGPPPTSDGRGLDKVHIVGRVLAKQ